MDNGWGGIPSNADKRLFAEDFVSSFMTSNWPTVVDLKDVADTAGQYREYIHNGFTGDIHMAVEFIDSCLDCLVLTDFVSMKNLGSVSTENFEEYAENQYVLHFSEGFEPTSFLMYCTRVTNMAGYFYVSGIKGALNLAVDCIVEALPEGDFVCETWDVLNNAAKVYVSVDESRMELLTPSESSDYSLESTDDGTEESDGNSEKSWETLSETEDRDT